MVEVRDSTKNIMEDHEYPTNGDKKVMLQFGNFTEWYTGMINYAKGKNKDLENLMVTELDPHFKDPDPEAMLGLRRIYSYDKFGYLRYEADLKENRERKKKFTQALPWMVSIMYGSITAPVLDKMKLNQEYEEAYNNNKVIKLIQLAQFCKHG